MPEEPRDQQPLTPDEPTPTETPAAEPAPVEQTSSDPTYAQPAYQAQTPTPAAEQTQPVSEPTAPVKQKRLKKPALVAIIIAAALVVLGGGGALAYNLWYQNPDKVVTDALMNAMTAKTVSVTGTLNVASEDSTVRVEVSGRNTTEANSAVAADLTFTSEDVSFKAGGEAIVSSEGDMYVKVNNVSELVDSLQQQAGEGIDLSVFDDIIAKIDGNWIMIGKDDLGDFSQEYEKTQQCYADISKSLESDENFKDTVTKETSDLYKENRFLIVGEKIGSRTINDQGSLGYTLEGDREKAKAFFAGFNDTALGQKFKECDESIDFNDLFTESNSTDDSNTTVEIWVSRFGHTLTELKASGEDDGTKTDIVFNPVFNESESVTIPTDVITLSELQSDIEQLFAQPSTI